jgi:hypothetical protein
MLFVLGGAIMSGVKKSMGKCVNKSTAREEFIRLQGYMQFIPIWGVHNE